MKVIIGSSKPGKAAALIKILIANKNTSLLLVRSVEVQNQFAKEHEVALAANGVNEARIVAVESLKLAMKHFSPESLIIDEAELLLGKILGLSEKVHVAALSLSQSDHIVSVEAISTSRKQVVQ